jgi:hypothetical protein
MNTGARMLKRGYTNDPEDSRRTARLWKARDILHGQDIMPTIAHSDYEVAGPALYGSRHECDLGCITTWMLNVHGDEGIAYTPSDEVFEAAYALADALASRPGIIHPAAILDGASMGRRSSS